MAPEVQGLIMIIILLSILGWMTGRMMGQRVSPFWLVNRLIRGLRSFVAGLLQWIARLIAP